MTVRVLTGDCLEVMPTLEPNSIDAVVCDPPYGIGFMGKAWDSFDENAVEASWATKGRNANCVTTRHGTTGVGFRKPNPRCGICGRAINGRDTAKGFKVCQCSEPMWMPSVNRDAHRFQEFMTEWAGECWRVMKPGARLLAFGGTRTYHRMACAIEDAGFEIEDSLCWLYGSGFPKHKSKLKPAHEPIVMARKPAPKATLLNIDACRLPCEPQSRPCGPDSDFLGQLKGRHGATWDSHASGRWPANVVLDEISAQLLDEMSGATTSNGGRPKSAHNWMGDAPYRDTANVGGLGDTGGASRFFYCAKASRSEREAGLDGFERRDARVVGNQNAQRCDECNRTHPNSVRECVCGGSLRIVEVKNAPRTNHHPTVKPVALMRWLVRLVTPPNGIVLDPFCGSGTTGVGAVLEDRRFIGIEREPEYAALAEARIARAYEQGSLFREMA